MNRQQRRAAKAQGKDVPPSFTVSRTETDEALAFSAKLQDAVQQVIVESGYHDIDKRRETAPLVVHGLGMTAVSHAILAGCSKDQLVEAMGVYYDQVCKHLESIAAEIKKRQEEKPLIVVPGKGD